MTVTVTFTKREADAVVQALGIALEEAFAESDSKYRAHNGHTVSAWSRAQDKVNNARRQVQR